MQEAGKLDEAVLLFRKAGRLRSEEPQSLRDLGLALAERGRANSNPGDVAEAMATLERVLWGTWDRCPEIELLVLEELNSLIAWSARQPWAEAPAVPDLDPRLVKNLDEDLRIVMTWDADLTDVDIHVVEPTGELAYYSNRHTAIGGRVSRDFTQGYGPEQYTVRRAVPGEYVTLAHYFASHQQTVFGPTTVMVTIFTNYGRPNETRQLFTIRLDEQYIKIEAARIRFGEEAAAERELEAAN